ncbi:hypothetical protein ONZ51_g9251 [Trametes cubensis]|uniref:Transmembrane protein n=1 Tax=Trametes cubensis TaxID=1111947 RepID=A0AAD7X7G6_9APHY|nr:hypothetical protein ONZ51_g9251 [Trametes cubensis]
MALTLDLAAVISTTLEGIFYGLPPDTLCSHDDRLTKNSGFSVFMFGMTLYILQQNSRRLDRQVNYRMVAVSWALLICSTAHMIIDIVRVCNGLVYKRDTFPGGPIAFFSSPSENTFIAKNIVYLFQTLLGDGVLIYRCYVVWQSWLIVAFPILLWFWIGIVSAVAIHASATVPAGAGTVFLTRVGQWITAFYASTLATNFLVSILLGYKIWISNRRTSRIRQGSLLPVVRVVADAGLLYSATLTAALACFVQKSNGQYIVLDIVTPIISITFYMVIIRVGLAATHRSSDHHSSASIDVGSGHHHHSRGHSGSRSGSGSGGGSGRVLTVGELESQAHPMGRLQVHITKMRETDRATFEAEMENDTGSELDRKVSGLDGRIGI